MTSIHIGSAPDSWGVWFPDDAEQTTPERFLAEVGAAGYDVIELGPYGFLPTDPERLADALRTHGLRVSAGTVFEHLHQPESWDHVWSQVTDVAALTRAVGGEHLVVIPEPWRDHKTGAPLEDPQLDAPPGSASPPAWTRSAGGCSRSTGCACSSTPTPTPTSGTSATSSASSRRPTRATSTSASTPGTSPTTAATTSRSSAATPSGSATCTSSRSTRRSIARVAAEDLPFPDAVRAGAMVEPPYGIPSMPEVLAAVEEVVLPLNPDVYAIIEQDMYPCPPDHPLPIAQRTHTYLASCGGASVRIGQPA